MRVIDYQAGARCLLGEKLLQWDQHSFRHRGTWSTLSQYNRNDIVVFQGSSYIATASVRSTSPGSAPWALLAASGRDGANGRNGANGANGRDGVNGRDGAAGAAGATGPAGPAGAPGTAGIPGRDGVNGVSGAQYGRFISTVIDIGSGLIAPSVAVGIDGYPVVASYDSTTGDLVVTHCKDRVCDTNEVRRISRPDGAIGTFPSIAIGADGFPVIAHVDSGNTVLYLTRCKDLACRTVVTPRSVEIGIGTARPALTIGTDGRPIVVYNRPNGTIVLAHCADTVCSSVTIRVLTAALANGTNPAVAIRPQGGLVIGVQHNNGLVAVVCADEDCASSSASNLTSASVGAAGQYPKLAIGTDRFASFTSFQPAQARYVLTHCLDESCQSSESSAVPSGYGAGYVSDLVVGTDGLPLVATWSPSSKGLYLIRCMTRSCSSFTPLLLSSDFSARFDPHGISMEIGADGQPALSIDTVDGLKLVKLSRSSWTQYGY